MVTYTCITVKSLEIMWRLNFCEFRGYPLPTKQHLKWIIYSLCIQMNPWYYMYMYNQTTNQTKLTIRKNNGPTLMIFHSNSISYQWNIHTWLWRNQCGLAFRNSYGPRLNDPRWSFNWNKISLSYCYMHHIIIYHKVHNSFWMKQMRKK